MVFLYSMELAYLYMPEYILHDYFTTESSVHFHVVVSAKIVAEETIETELKRVIGHIYFHCYIIRLTCMLVNVILHGLKVKRLKR